MKRTLLWKRARRGRQFYVLYTEYYYDLVARNIKTPTAFVTTNKTRNN